MTTLTIEEIAERRLELIQRLMAERDTLVAQNRQLRRIINEFGSLLKAPSINEEPKEEEQ
jgi:plasmid stabilization system protein ParE